MQTISTYVVHYRNLFAKGKNAATPILADVIVTRCPVQDQLWISVVQLNRGRKQQVFERIPCGIKCAVYSAPSGSSCRNATVSVRVGGAMMIFEARLRGGKDASERQLFRNLQFAGPAPPRRFAIHFQNVAEADEFLYRVQTVLDVGDLDEPTIAALGPTLEGTDLPPALTALGGKGKRKKPAAAGDAPEEASQLQSQVVSVPEAASAPVVPLMAPNPSPLAESQQMSGSQEITFRIDIATATLPNDTRPAAASTAMPRAAPPPNPAPAPPLPAPPQSTPPEPKELCGVCKLTQFALETNQGMVFCDKCQKWYHARCGGLTETQFNAMRDTDPFTCKSCVPAPQAPVVPVLAPPTGVPLPRTQAPANTVAPPPVAAEPRPQVPAPPPAAPANKRKLEETLSDGSQQSQVLSGYSAAASQPSAVVRAPSFRAPVELQRAQAASSQAQAPSAPAAAAPPRPAAATTSASQAPQRAKSPPRDQGLGFRASMALAPARATGGDAQQSQAMTVPAAISGGEAALQQEQNEDLGVFQSLLQAMKSATPTPSPAEQSLRLYVTECLRDPAFPDLVNAVEKVWKELEIAGRLPASHAK